ncbi:MAG: hypothetical protein AB2A00_30200 [Myxococcota bacterium]
MGALMVVLLCQSVMAQEDKPLALVEVSSVEGDEAATPREMVQVEDAIAIAYTNDLIRVETKRQRIARIPYSIYMHAQELNACANPTWPKQRVLNCVDSLKWPNPMPKQPRLSRITHTLRIARQKSKEGETLAVSFSAVGTGEEETVVRRTLPKDATQEERKAAALEMAAEVLAPLRGVAPRPR